MARNATPARTATKARAATRASAAKKKRTADATVDAAAAAEPAASHREAVAHEMAARQREISVSEFFTKNRHLLGFDNPRKALLTAVKEAVDNSLDACEEAGILPDITVVIAFAAGFGSVRRFNETFQQLFRRPPSTLRRKAVSVLSEGSVGEIGVTVRLSYRPPYDWAAMLGFLKARAIAGVEWIIGDVYCRTVQQDGLTGTVEIGQGQRTTHAQIVADVLRAHGLNPVSPAGSGRGPRPRVSR